MRKSTSCARDSEAFATRALSVLRVRAAHVGQYGSSSSVKSLRDGLYVARQAANNLLCDASDNSLRAIFDGKALQRVLGVLCLNRNRNHGEMRCSKAVLVLSIIVCAEGATAATAFWGPNPVHGTSSLNLNTRDATHEVVDRVRCCSSSQSPHLMVSALKGTVCFYMSFPLNQGFPSKLESVKYLPKVFASTSCPSPSPSFFATVRRKYTRLLHL